MAAPHLSGTPAPAATPALADPRHGVDHAVDTTSLTVIVPTRNESANVAELVRRLDATLRPLTDAGHGCSIVFVDDSDDDTAAAVEAEQAHVATDLYCVHRPLESRWGGLGG